MTWSETERYENIFHPEKSTWHYLRTLLLEGHHYYTTIDLKKKKDELLIWTLSIVWLSFQILKYSLA